MQCKTFFQYVEVEIAFLNIVRKHKVHLSSPIAVIFHVFSLKTVDVRIDNSCQSPNMLECLAPIHNLNAVKMLHSYRVREICNEARVNLQVPTGRSSSSAWCPAFKVK